MADFNTINSSISLRRAPRSGPNTSAAWNDTIEELTNDLAALMDFANNVAIPIFNGLGRAGTYTDVNPVGNGLDGTTMMTNKDSANSTTPYFYDTAKARPKTVFETATQITNDLDTLFSNINEINARLGTSDTTATDTNPATLSEIENQLNYFIGVVRTLQSSTGGFLTASGIATALADGTVDPSTFNLVDADISALAAIAATKVSGVDLTTAYSYVSGVPANYDMRDTVLRLKEFVEDIGGDDLVTFAGSGLTGDSLKTHRDKSGTGTVSATNPHGLDIADLDDGSNLLAKEQMVGDFAFLISGTDESTWTGGHAYVNRAFTVTRVAATLDNGGTTGLNVSIWRRRASVNAEIYSGLIVPATTPGSAVATTSFTNTDLQAGDLLFLSGIIEGDSYGARFHAWGTPA